ncbi:hypothetical protein EX30DRAFT_341386 [Ascodesmis nigricans]|uniref:Terminase ATPase subunit N-terminal domain-containing protein n=1 Tax=Ascodesmis nigricans TaxID=341454 RepID=A0A4S2MVW5_9PEZI|nr:hypothetical protein EX30DRAFT_341386 [Ascodesmis nigricans]
MTSEPSPPQRNGPRSEWSLPERARVLALYEAGWSKKVIAKHSGIGHTNIIYWCRSGRTRRVH